MSINIENADAYFAAGNHVCADVWNAYTADSREAAVATAKRQLSRALGRPMKENEGEFTDASKTRDEYAVYEQALYLLRTRPTASGAPSPYPVALDAVVAEGSAATVEKFSPFSDDALRWLGWTGVSIVRG